LKIPSFSSNLQFKYLLAIILFSAAIILTACVRHTKYNQFLPKPQNNLRIATYNLYWNNGTCEINHPKSSTRLMQFINADILLLQEVTPKLNQCIESTLKKYYPHIEFKPHGREGGLAIYSKYPFTTTHYILPKHGWFPAWIVNAHTPKGNIQLLNLHLRPSVDKGNNVGLFAAAIFATPAIRMQEIKQFTSYVTHNKPTIIAGDFNEGDTGDTIHYLKQLGYQDALSKNQSSHTWRHYAGPFLLINRYDRIFFSRHFQIKYVQVLHESSSDHYPVVADVLQNP